MEKAKEYSKLISRIHELESELRTMKARRNELEEELLDWFTEPNSPDRVTIAGRTLFPMRQVWVSVKDESGIKALKENGLEELVKETVNTQTLSAWYREVERDEGVPPWAREALNVTEKYKVGTRKEN